MRTSRTRAVVAIVVAVLALVAWLLATTFVGDSPPTETPLADPAAQHSADAAADPPSHAGRSRARAGRDDVSTDAAADDAPGAPAVVRVRVLDDDGDARPGATVRAARLTATAAQLRDDAPDALLGAWPGAWSVTATTDTDGLADLALSEGRAWLVQATADGCATDSEIVSAGDETLVVLSVVSAPARALRVQTEFGDPIAGAEVLVVRDRWTGPPCDRAVTDEHGDATVRCVEDEPLLVRAAGYATLRTRVAGDCVTLRPAFDVGGVVVDAAGAPLAGAEVRIVRHSAPDVLCTTGANGEFVAPALDPATSGRTDAHFTAHAAAPGFLPARTSLRCGVRDARVILRRGADVSGEVVFADDTPAAAATVTAHVAYEMPVKAVTDAAGRFTLCTAAGGVQIEAAHGRLAGIADHVAEHVAHTALDVAEGARVAGVRLVLDRTPVSHVAVCVVRHDGRPAAGALVTVFADVRGVDVIEALTSDDGVVRVAVPCMAGTAFQAGAHLLEGDDDQGRLGRLAGGVSGATSARDDAPPLELRLRAPVVVTIRAVGDDGAPIADAWVRHDGGRRSSPCVVRVDPEVAMRGEAGAPGHVPEEFVLEGVTDGATYDIRLFRGATLRGRIVDTRGNPVAGARVALPTSSQQRVLHPTGADGRFELRLVPPGAHRLDVSLGASSAVAATHATRTFVDVAVAERAVLELGDVRIWGLAEMRGRVTTADGAPVVAALVTASWFGGGLAHAVTDGSGRYRFRVAAGPPLELEVEHPTAGRSAQTLEPVSVEGADADVRLGTPRGESR